MENAATFIGLDLAENFFLVTIFESVALKLDAFSMIYTERSNLHERTVAVLLPPLCASLIYCIIAIIVERLLGCQGVLRRRRLRALGESTLWQPAR